MTAHERRPVGPPSASPAKTTDAILRAALEYVEDGWRVFPCRPWDKKPLTPNGFQDATSDPDRVVKWWRTWPDANVATPTGAGSVDVLDVDVRRDGDGWDSFETLRTRGRLAGARALVMTPCGGLHLHFPGSSQSCSRLREQFIDFKATGGYVLLPPSQVVTPTYRGVYSWLDRTDGGSPLDWLAARRILTPPQPAVPPTPSLRSSRWASHLTAWMSRQPEGNRNNALFWAACRMLEAGRGDLKQLADAAKSTGLHVQEVVGTVESARRTVLGVRDEPR